MSVKSNLQKYLNGNINNLAKELKKNKKLIDATDEKASTLLHLAAQGNIKRYFKSTFHPTFFERWKH